MSFEFIIGVVLGITASILLNVGKGVQKFKIHVFKHKMKVFSSEHRGDLSIWCLGLFMLILAPPAFSLALKYTDKPSLAAAMSGVGLVALMVFSKYVLKEVVGRVEFLSISMIIVGTIVIGWFDKPILAEQVFDKSRLIYVAVTLISLAIAAVAMKKKMPRLFGYLISVLVGSFLAMGLNLGDMALVDAGNSFVDQVRSPFMYLAILSGNGAFVLTQMALWVIDASVVVPILNASIVLSSIVIEYILFGTSFNSIQFIGVALIAVGVIILVRKRLLSSGAEKA